jgi:hypothetical protein
LQAKFTINQPGDWQAQCRWRQDRDQRGVLAAEAGGPVRMREIMRAARSEYGKIDGALTRELED